MILRADVYIVVYNLEVVKQLYLYLSLLVVYMYIMYYMLRDVYIISYV